MSDTAIRKELATLREQVAALHSTRAQGPPQQEFHGSDSSQPNEELQSAGGTGRASSPIEDEETLDVEKQIQEFVTALEQEIKGTNPMTVLVVFSLGVLIGRMLPR